MSNLTLSRKNRARTKQVACHDTCDSNMAPRNIKALRRNIKRAEKNQWKKNPEA